MPSFLEVVPGVYQWTDTCNVYVIRDGDAALLIDFGDGSVVDHLSEIGVKTVEWVLFTHHHREQCQGATDWKRQGTKLAASATERPLFENPTAFRKIRPTLGDAFTVHGASYVRPPVAPIPIDHAFARMDDFTWRGREFWVVETQGNAPGHTASFCAAMTSRDSMDVTRTPSVGQQSFRTCGSCRSISTNFVVRTMP
jgi:glyoxylase-like metal-dependent hydrolase (beta-lactamase superfamily II)